MAEPSGPRFDPKAEETAERYVHAIGEGGGIKPGSTLFQGQYRVLFSAQFVSSLGDWIGFLAIVGLAANLGKSNANVAVGAVLSARLIPGFFFGAFASGLIDRWDRKKVMVTCDIGRGLIYAAIPFLHNVPAIFVASLFLELLTLMWTPAKEATVPNLVTREQLASANTASLLAAYGTILPALLLSPALTWLGTSLATHVHYLRFLKNSKQGIAFYADVLSFMTSATLISRLRLPPKTEEQKERIAAATLASTWHDAKEGWRFIGQNYRVRAVIIGFCTALIGGGMTVPLATTFAQQILHNTGTAFNLLAMSLGLGVAIGVGALTFLQQRLSHDLVFRTAVLGAGVCLIFAASMAHIGLVMLGIGGLGICAGAVYVVGFTIIGSINDDIRGRIFAAFYALVRLCLLLAFTLAPFLSQALDSIADNFSLTVHGHVIHREIGTAAFHIAIPGTRLTLLLGGVIILVAGLIARRDLHKAASDST